MSHSHHSSRASAAGKARAKHILGHKSGGKVEHSDAAEDAAMIKKAMGAHDKQLHGGKHTDLGVIGEKRGGRLDKFARGGRTKGKHHTQVNIAVVAPHGPSSGAGGDAPPAHAVPPAPMSGGLPPGAGGPPPGMMPPPGAGAGGPPPGAMPPGIPPGMGPKPFKRGGGVASTKPAQMGKGAGAGTGQGRLDAIKSYGKNARKKD